MGFYESTRIVDGVNTCIDHISNAIAAADGEGFIASATDYAVTVGSNIASIGSNISSAVFNIDEGDNIMAYLASNVIDIGETIDPYVVPTMTTIVGAAVGAAVGTYVVYAGYNYFVEGKE